MKHIHEKTGLEYDVSRLIDFDGKTHDMCIITKWDVEKESAEKLKNSIETIKQMV